MPYYPRLAARLSDSGGCFGFAPVSHRHAQRPFLKIPSAELSLYNGQLRVFLFLRPGRQFRPELTVFATRKATTCAFVRPFALLFWKNAGFSVYILLTSHSQDGKMYVYKGFCGRGTDTDRGVCFWPFCILRQNSRGVQLSQRTDPEHAVFGLSHKKLLGG